MVECSRVMVECSHVRLGSRLTADVWIYVASCLSICYTYYIYRDTMMYNCMYRSISQVDACMRRAGSRDCISA